MKFSVTICLAEEMSGGPFIYHGNLRTLPSVLDAARQLGYDAVELLVKDPMELGGDSLGAMVRDAGLTVSAIGTGFGAIGRGWTLTHADASVRKAAQGYVDGCVTLALGLHAHVIIGSMQGRVAPGRSRSEALSLLQTTIHSLAERVNGTDTRILVEPLNRYETDVLNTLAEGCEFVEQLGMENVAVLADLFHMNIEEPSICKSLESAWRHVKHFHLADSNRRPAGCGHTDLASVGNALRRMQYDGYVAIEAFPYPDSTEAARNSLRACRNYFQGNR